MNLSTHPVEAAEGGMSDCALTVLATEIPPRSHENSSGTGVGDSRGRSSPGYCYHTLKRQTLLIPPTIARIEEIRGRMGMESWMDERQTRGFSPAFYRLPLPDSPHRKEEAPEPPQEDVRAEFNTHYQKEAQEYDKEFVKKHDDDLNTTLMFVSPICYGGTRVLTRAAGRSVFRCGFYLHYRGQL